MKKLSQKRKLDYVKQTLYSHENPNCEVCGGKVIDSPHHIIYRSQGGKADDNNLISLCRREHDRAHFRGAFSLWLYREDLWIIKGFGLELDKMREKYKLARSGCKTK